MIREPWSVWHLPDGEIELHAAESGELLLSVEGEQRAKLERVKDLYNALLSTLSAQERESQETGAATPKENQ